MSAYLDATVLLPTVLLEKTTPAIFAYFAGWTRELLISDFAATEVVSGLSRLVRMRELDADDAIARLADFETWRASAGTPAETHASDVRLAYTYVRRFELKLRAPDALHLALARRLGATLVTFDRRLADAAGALGIATEMPTTP